MENSQHPASQRPESHHSQTQTPKSPLGVSQLPEPLLGSHDAMLVRGCKSATTLWLDIKGGTFPPPDKVIHGVRKWKASTLRNWVDGPNDATHA
jgi:hypothetical protein